MRERRLRRGAGITAEKLDGTAVARRVRAANHQDCANISSLLHPTSARNGVIRCGPFVMLTICGVR
jgi:hypothetical protein